MINHRLKCIQVHIPKTAGISIRSLFFPNFDINKNTDKNMHIKPFHPYYKPYWNEYFTFIFVRNPWERIISCYNFCFTKPTGDILNRTIPQKYPTFDEFVIAASREMLRHSQRFEPMFHWFDNDLKYDFVGRTEELVKGMIFISNKLDLGLNAIPKLNTGNVTNYYKYYEGKPELVDKVYKLYKEDIDYFGYKFEDLR